MSGPLRWDAEGRQWPHRDSVRFVDAAGLRWLVLRMGQGPVVLLLHGTGASTHSWRDIAPALSDRATVVAVDLPGHAFTSGRLAGGPTLPRMAAGLRALLEKEGIEPALVVAHSAGTAIALQMVRDGMRVPVVGFGASLTPFQGLAARLFPALAKVLFVNPLVPSIFARMARAPGEAKRFLVRATNSQIDAAGLRCYATLLGNSRHCRGALAMMANWDLASFAKGLGAIDVPVLLVHGERDNAIPLSSVREAQAKLPDGEVVVVDGLGHLAHEERPAEAVDLIVSFAIAHGILPTGKQAGD